jgi:hypothetical protein
MSSIYFSLFEILLLSFLVVSPAIATRINLVFQFAPEKLGRFEHVGYNFLVF